MSGGYSRTPRMLKGALVQFSGAMIGSAPNIIVFQYNPETLTRSVSPYDVPDPPTHAAGEGAAGAAEAATATAEDAQPFDPTETFTLQLLLDAADALEQPDQNAVAVATGVADRIAALEILLYPGLDQQETGLLGSAAGSLGSAAGLGGPDTSTPEGAEALGTGDQPDPRSTVPTLLFVWGPGRIVPVRLTSFSVEELQYNTLLYPHRAKVSLGMRVITAARLRRLSPRKAEYDLAQFAYEYTLGQKQLLALANLVKTADALIGGVLPF